MRPAPTVPLALTAAELRALAGVHNSFADAADDFGLYVQAGDGRDRADLLRRVAEQVGPPAMAAAGLLGMAP